MKRLAVLIIEDDGPTLEMLKTAIETGGHLVHTAKTLEEGYNSVTRSPPDLIVMDRGLPDGDGIRLCMTLKKDSRFRAIPLLMLTGKSEVMDKVLGLRLGADDYLAKPFDMEEVLARLDALVRRAAPGLAGSSALLECAGVRLDLAGRRVTAGGEEVPLTRLEFELLRILLERAGAVLTRDFLLEAVWKGSTDTIVAKAVDVAVMGLRRKLGRYGSHIVAVPGCGYKFIAPGKRGR